MGLLDFGRTSAQITQARAGRDEAEAQYRQVVLGAFQDAENSLARFAQQRRNVAALAEIKRSADESDILTQQRFQRQVISAVTHSSPVVRKCLLHQTFKALLRLLRQVMSPSKNH